MFTENTGSNNVPGEDDDDMAWGKPSSGPPAGDLIDKVVRGTPSLVVLPFRTFGEVECAAHRVTVLNRKRDTLRTCASRQQHTVS